jgi:hypothetical protein
MPANTQELRDEQVSAIRAAADDFRRVFDQMMKISAKTARNG